MKPNFRLKYKNDETNDYQSIEYFHLDEGIVLHHHLLTDNSDRQKLYPIVRKIGKLYSCTQVIHITNMQFDDLLKSILKFKSNNK